mgnify:CR=1 FL=1
MATIHDYARMCRSFGGRCSICPLNKFMDKYMKNCGRVLFIHASEVSAIIDKWCSEHPQKTYKQDFLEKFPKAAMYGNGCLIDCRNNVYGWKGRACIGNCIVCWHEVMPEETGNE